MKRRVIFNEKVFKVLCVINVLISILPSLLILEMAAPGLFKINQQVYTAYFVCIMFSIVVSSVTLIMFIIYHKLYKDGSNISYGALVINLILNILYILFYIGCILPLVLVMTSWN